MSASAHHEGDPSHCRLVEHDGRHSRDEAHEATSRSERYDTGTLAGEATGTLPGTGLEQVGTGGPVSKRHPR
jgi:hypothetical protein